MSLYEWNFQPPSPSSLGDHDVPLDGAQLAGRRIALMVCGGIAAMKAPFVARALRRRGAEVVAFASEEALRYVAADTLEWATNRPIISRLTYKAEHLSDGAPFDAYLVAPATYNTINKVASGVADGVITAAMASALGRLSRGQSAVLMAPTMHGSMHNPILVESCRRLAAMGVFLVAPRDDYGKHNLPDEAVLVAAVCRAVSRSPLRGKRVLVTGGPTPTPIDGVRRLTNRFRGRLGAEIAAELVLRGADTLLIHGDGAWRPPAWIPYEVAHTYEDYKTRVLSRLDAGYAAGVFSAGVADYRPKVRAEGKIPSGLATLRLELEPTEKVIDLARAEHPELHVVAFKYLEGVPHERLMEVARARLTRYPAVVANRSEEWEGGQQVAWLFTQDGEQPLVGKPAIAQAICDHLERRLSD